MFINNKLSSYVLTCNNSFVSGSSNKPTMFCSSGGSPASILSVLYTTLPSLSIVIVFLLSVLILFIRVPSSNSQTIPNPLVLSLMYSFWFLASALHPNVAKLFTTLVLPDSLSPIRLTIGDLVKSITISPIHLKSFILTFLILL